MLAAKLMEEVAAAIRELTQGYKRNPGSCPPEWDEAAFVARFLMVSFDIRRWPPDKDLRELEGFG